MIHSSESWRKIVGKLLRGRTKNRREIPMISKYSVFVVGTRRINSICMSKKFSVTLTSESVTSGQAGGVFRQFFSQCIFDMLKWPWFLRVRLNVFQQTVYTVACVQGTALITLSVSFNNICHISPNAPGLKYIVRLCMEYVKTGVLFRMFL